MGDRKAAEGRRGQQRGGRGCVPGLHPWGSGYRSGGGWRSRGVLGQNPCSIADPTGHVLLCPADPTRTEVQALGRVPSLRAAGPSDQEAGWHLGIRPPHPEPELLTRQPAKVTGLAQSLLPQRSRSVPPRVGRSPALHGPREAREDLDPFGQSHIYKSRTTEQAASGCAEPTRCVAPVTPSAEAKGPHDTFLTLQVGEKEKDRIQH